MRQSPRASTCASATASCRRDADLVIDCRGLAAKDELPTLRGVRGERIVVKSREVDLWRARPAACIRAFPSTSCPGATAFYMIGATVIESEETGAITLRSALDLLSAAYALDPAFAEAEIVRQGAGARPAFPDNRPRIIAGEAAISTSTASTGTASCSRRSGRARRRPTSRPARRDPEVFRCTSCSTVKLSPPTPETLDELCARLGFAEAKIATAVNGSFVAAAERRPTQLAQADEIEIVAPRQGG